MATNAVTLRIPTQLRSLTAGEATVAVDAETVGQALSALASRFPEMHPRLFDDAGRLRRFVNVFLAEEDVRFLDGLDSKVEPGQSISIVPAVAGG